ncbi:hypothetical protein Q8814_19945, partial [Rhodococcus sp. CC-R104]|nr:hypothetical protein [Rhodococcus sp. CC-R104]
RSLPMTKNSARKKAARAYQADHPGTSLPEAMRAVAASPDSSPAAGPGEVHPDGTRRSRPSTAGVDPQTTAEAIAALTAIARSTRADGSAVDFADTLAEILTVVAANVGSRDRLLAGRPTSWETDLVAQLVAGTAPADELAPYRTEPVRLTLHLDECWRELGMEDLFLDDMEEIDQLYDGLDEDSDAAAALAREQLAIETLEEADKAAFVAAFTEHARRAAADLGITAPVEVIVVGDTSGGAAPAWDPIEDRLAEAALRRTPHPIADASAAERWEQGLRATDLAAALRHAPRRSARALGNRAIFTRGRGRARVQGPARTSATSTATGDGPRTRCRGGRPSPPEESLTPAGSPECATPGPGYHRRNADP